MREVSDRNILDEFCISFCRVVEKFTDYIIVSGFVAISSGRVRGTEDIDMIIDPISREKCKALHRALEKSGFICSQTDDADEVYSYLKEKLAVRYTKRDEPLPEMEMKFAKDQLDRYQLKTRMKLELTGLPVWFSSINMNIAFKEYYLKSDKDIEDARHLRIVYSDQVDEQEISEIKKLIKRYRP